MDAQLSRFGWESDGAPDEGSVVHGGAGVQQIG